MKTAYTYQRFKSDCLVLVEALAKSEASTHILQAELQQIDEADELIDVSLKKETVTNPLVSSRGITKLYLPQKVEERYGH